MIISHKHRFIFFATPKTGTTSLESALQGYGDKLEAPSAARSWWAHKHVTPALIKAVLEPDIWNSYFKFAFVRHPADWFISQYGHNSRLRSYSRKRVRRKSMGRLKLYWRYRKEEKLEIERRREWSAVNQLNASWVQKLHDWMACYKVRPMDDSLYQHPYIFDNEGSKLVDYVGRFETLDEDIANICERIGIQIELGHINSSEHKPWEQSFTGDGLELHTQLYSRDYDLLGYDRPTESDLAS